MTLGDDDIRELYWCVVLKFQRDLLLTTPSDTVMTAMIGILEPMCQLEEVLEIGATHEEELERQETDRHHREAQDALVAANVAAVSPTPSPAAAAGAASAGATDPGVSEDIPWVSLPEEFLTAMLYCWYGCYGLNSNE